MWQVQSPPVSIADRREIRLTDTIIVTHALTKSFGRLLALDRLELKVLRGEIHGFIGPNGAGKSTTMRILIGATKPSRGMAQIGGHAAGSREANRLLGYSPERPALMNDMTARDYLVYMAMLSGLRTGAAEQAAIDVLAWQGLVEFADVRIKGFSAGMKQRLTVAQAMAHQPEVLILDEPTANLDAGGRASLLEKLKALPQKRGTTIFISSHILSELEFLADRATFISKGSVVMSGTMKELKQNRSRHFYLLSTSDDQAVLAVLDRNPIIQEAWLGKDDLIHLVAQDATELESVVTSAVGHCGCRLRQFSEESLTLEDIYQNVLGEKENE